MTAHSPLRFLVCLSILTLALLTSAVGAAASTLIPMVDTGGSGGGGGTGTLDETDRALALIETSDTSSTAGTLDETDRALALIETSDTTVASGEPSWPLTANARSIQLTESRNAPGGILAGVPAPPVRAAYEDSEHAVAQNRVADDVVIVETNRGQPH